MALGLTVNRSPISSPKLPGSIDLLGSKVDLNSLYSPFIAEPPTALEESSTTTSRAPGVHSRSTPSPVVVRSPSTSSCGNCKACRSTSQCARRTRRPSKAKLRRRLREGSDDEDGYL
ncbi:hypothetical protein FA95DRAFT_1149670 [Auriscalpium vulgare]|uniref:Uncharacterized protein n=1 Tax=Auriscalpium vulgare TaxID=40419 RepID=A0ACB8R4C8_9AGAM|nr:hypothetical protein FA95DRAFT_1149670 [Auriscalpium vulgare]